MLIQRKKPDVDALQYLEAVQDMGSIDYVKNGEIVKDAPMKMVMVGSSSDLDSVVGYEAGTLAFTAGFGNIWQLDVNGEWQEVE